MDDNIATIITQLTDNVGMATEKLYIVLLKQAFIHGIFWTVGLVVLWVILYLLYKALRRQSKKKEEDENWGMGMEEESLFLGWVLFISAAGISVLGSYTVLENIITGFINPEFWALKTLLSGM